MIPDDGGRCIEPGCTEPGGWVPRPDRITDDHPSPWFPASPSDRDRFCHRHGPDVVVPKPDWVTKRRIEQPPDE